MIAFLRGNIIDLGHRHVVIENNDIGYKVYVTEDSLHTLKLNTPASLWIHMVIREDTQDLYGFISKKDREFFELLISVSGIGPKSALNILSLVASETLASAIRSGSVAHLVKVSGIGKKTAEKIVLELKDKLAGFGSVETSAEMSSDADAIEALKALGFDQNDAREALKKVGNTTSNTSAKVKAALKVLS